MLLQHEEKLLPDEFYTEDSVSPFEHRLKEEPFLA